MNSVITILRTVALLTLLHQGTNQEKEKLDLYIELIGQANNGILTSLRYAANKTTTQNSSLDIHFGNVSAQIGTSDLFQYADSMKGKVALFLEAEKVGYRSCTISSLLEKPLITLRDRPHDLSCITQCGNVMSVSPDTESFARATEEVIVQNPEWQKIIILYETNKASQVAHTQHQLSSRISTTRLLMAQSNETEDALIHRTWYWIVEMGPHAVIPLVNENFIGKLLQMQTCSLKVPLAWLIQGSFRSNWTSAGENIVVGFHLPMPNPSNIQKIPIPRDALLAEEHDKEDAFLAHDALLLIAKATDDARHDGRWNKSNDSSMVTINDLLKEYILKTSVQGITGDIQINSNFVRQVDNLQVLNLHNNTSVQIGEWTLSGGLSLSQPMAINFQSDACKQPPLEGHTLRVTVLEVHPYIIKNNRSGSISYEGFCIDLLDRLARDLKFNYVIEDCPDQQYGALFKGKWNGMVGQLVDKKVDMSGAPLAVTSSRESVVDFTVVYQHFTDNLLLSRAKEEYMPFAFIRPLSQDIWYCLAGTVCIVGFLIFVLNYLSPYGLKDQQAKDLSILNSLWFALSCILQQGTSERPKSLSGRVFAGVYWFCILIFVSTYTANLTAYFTAKSATKTIKNIQDLIMDTKKEVTVLYASSAYSFFKYTDYEEFQQLWNRMKKFPNTTKMAIDWTKNSDLVYIEASPIIDYIAAQDCDLKTVPGLSNTQGLAFALPQGSIYKQNISLRLLHMEEEGFIRDREKYWWMQNTNCPKYTYGSLESKEVKLGHMLGVYFLFGGGSLFAVMVLIAEILWHRKSGQKVECSPQESTCDMRARSEPSGTSCEYQEDVIILNN